MSRATTLADVAAYAGVSGKTVSRVVNRDANVSKETRDRVEAAISALHFRPNPAARSLAAARSFLIGSLTVGLPSFYYAELFRGAMRACRARGYHLVVDEFGHGTEPIVDIYERDLRNMAYDGLILPPPVCDDLALLDALDRDGMRYVRISPATDVGRSASVFAEDEKGVTALVEHMWASGHRRFGMVTGPVEHASTAVRKDAFLSAVTRLGGDAREVATAAFVWNGSMMMSGRQAGVELLDRASPPTAIFAFNDEMAAGIMALAHERGMRVPADLAVAGFDDADASKLTWPQITTIRQPIAQMAQVAVEQLIAPPTDKPYRTCCAVEFIVRGSTCDGIGMDDIRGHSHSAPADPLLRVGVETLQPPAE
ncbi:MAG: hypothetical protein JWR77_1754 [Rhizorhabdus sp.]|nr:hypothetical protein [Rhizorhabdus sp.]